MKNIYDVIIIGSGPAGLSAAIYSVRAGLSMLIMEKETMSGGQVLNTYEVDNYPGLPGINGFDLGMKFREHADLLGAEFVSDEVTGLEVEESVKRVITDGHIYEAKSIILATGASYAKLGVKGEEELSGMGVSYCATCDGAFFKNKVTAVIGGGDVAVEDAVFLARGCEKVYLIHRRGELRAAKRLQEKLFSLPNIEILWDSVLEQIEGVQKTEAITVKNLKNEEIIKISVDGVFIAVGIQPNTQWLPEIIKKDDKGYLITEEDGSTNVPGVFAAGDIRRKLLRQIITAAADGANAVAGVQEYMINQI